MVSLFRFRNLMLALLVVTALPCRAQAGHAYKYFRVGNTVDASSAKPRPGYALMGGGEDLDEAFQWLCDRARGGDLLVLRATGTDAYNPYIRKLCPKLNSVATLVIPDREAADDLFVAQTIRHASALFLSGGDQANYINFWMGTPVQTALNDAIARGIPLGGTSAGLAVMGEYAYSAQGDRPDDKDLDSKTALADPFNPRVTLVHGFLQLPLPYPVITDSHFVRRVRMGRLIAFLARLNGPEGSWLRSAGQDQLVQGVGVDERTALLVEPDGNSEVVGKGSVYFLVETGEGQILTRGKPLSLGSIYVQKVTPGNSFDLRIWEGAETRYVLSVQAGVLHSERLNDSIY